MSSGTVNSVGELGKLLRSRSGAELVGESSDGPAGGLTDRQLILNKLWSYVRCANYEGRAVEWDGSQHVSHLEAEAIVTSGFLPGGFYDARQSNLPLRFRRPSTPYYLAKAIVGRFNGLLFGSKHHPNTVVPDDPDTDDWLSGFVEATRLWSKMTLARTYGGAMGSSAIGFVFKNGEPRVEVHDPRWCTPSFEDREELIVSKFEKRYQYKDTIISPQGQVEAWFWYRRVIDHEKDIVWPRVPVDHGREGEPRWTEYRSLTTHHGFGFCPIVWIQNTEVQDDLDGDPDCFGAYDNIESIDALTAQAQRGVLANCDPTLHIATDDDVPDDLRKGSDNSIVTTAGGSVSYLEINGSGPKAAMEMAEQLEVRVLRLCRCVLEDNFGGPARTEKEVDQNYANMLEQAELLREQYGERGVKRLLSMVLKAARLLEQPRVVDGEVPTISRQVVRLPRSKKDNKPRKLGTGEMIDLDWPDWYEPDLSEISSAVTAASQALEGGLINRELAVRFIADYFHVEDVQALLEELEKDADQGEAAEAYDTGGEFGEEMPSYDVDFEDDFESELEGLADEFAPESFDDEFGELEDEFEEDEAAGPGVQESNAIVALLERVYAGEIPASAAEAVLRYSYPRMTDETIAQMLSEAGFAAPTAEAAPAEPTESAPKQVDVAKTALNGAQVAAMAALVEKASQGLLPRDSVRGMLKVAFGLTDAEALEVLGPETFTPSMPAEDGKLPTPEDVVAATEEPAEEPPADDELTDDFAEPTGEPEF